MQAVHLLSLLVEHTGERPVFLRGSTSDSLITHSAIMMELGAAWSWSRVSGRRVAPRQSAGRPPQRPCRAPSLPGPQGGVWKTPVGGQKFFRTPFWREPKQNGITVPAAALF